MNQLAPILSRLDQLSQPAAKHVTDADLQPVATAIAEALRADSCAITLSSDPDDHARLTLATVLEAPIAIGAKRYGVIRIHRSGAGFGLDDWQHLQLIGWCIARTVEAIRLQSVLGSHFTKLALAPANGRSARQVIAASAQHPDKTARLLARTFYRELARAGFTCNQIIGAASEIISQLSSNLREHKSPAPARDVATSTAE